MKLIPGVYELPNSLHEITRFGFTARHNPQNGCSQTGKRALGSLPRPPYLPPSASRDVRILAHQF
ncbi:hypothetical protein BH10PSE11_BH10PSE11_08230 [soil metagenome]